MYLVSPGANTADNSYVQRYLSSTFGIWFISETCVCEQLNSQPETPDEEEEGDYMIGHVRGRDRGTQQRGKEMQLVVG